MANSDTFEVGSFSYDGWTEVKDEYRGRWGLTAPVGIDVWSGSGGPPGGDRTTHNAGEPATLVRGFGGDGGVSGHYRLQRDKNQSSPSGEPGETVIDFGELPARGQTSFILPDRPGRYVVTVDGIPVARPEVLAGEGGESVTYPDDGPDPIDPSEYAGIVNADNDQGVALAPALRREGASIGPDGATVNLPDGETVEVGAISEADEVARYVEGDRAGEVVDADREAVDGGSTGGIGGAVGGVILLVAAAIAALGGYN